MEKRVVLAVVLCLATLLIWYRLFPPPTTPPAPQGSVSAPQGSAPSSDKGSPTPGATTEVKPAPAGDRPPGPTPEQLPEQLTVVERPGLYRAVVTSHGAALKSYELLHHKYFTRDSRRLVLHPGASQPEVERRQTDEPTNLITSYKPSLGVRFPRSGFQLPEVKDQVWTRIEDAPEEGNGHRLVYRWESADVVLLKTLRFLGSAYQIDVSVELKNKKSTPLNHHLEIAIEGFHDPHQKSGGIFSARVPQNEAAWDRSGKMQSANLEALVEHVPAEKLRGDLHWIAVGQQYFIIAAALQHGEQIGDKQAHATAEANGAISISAEYNEKTLAPGESTKYPMAFYAGPKLPELLESVSVAGQPAGLTTSINFQSLPVLGWLAEPLVRPMLWILRQIYALVHSWALAIVLLTMLVKLVTIYPTYKSMQSMKGIADLRPQIEVLKEKCGEDKQKFNTEMMALYKKHGVSPFGGCLPMLVQMPIWIALYSMLSSAVELYREPFLTPRWIADLTVADPYFILPLATGALMYLQTKLSPPATDPQQKMMANMMPVMFTFFSLFLPSGLTIYILTNTVLGMVQQFIFNRGKTTAAVVAAPAPAK